MAPKAPSHCCGEEVFRAARNLILLCIFCSSRSWRQARRSSSVRCSHSDAGTPAAFRGEPCLARSPEDGKVDGVLSLWLAQVVAAYSLLCALESPLAVPLLALSLPDSSSPHPHVRYARLPAQHTTANITMTAPVFLGPHLLSKSPRLAHPAGMRGNMCSAPGTPRGASDPQGLVLINGMLARPKPAQKTGRGLGADRCCKQGIKSGRR